MLAPFRVVQLPAGTVALLDEQHGEDYVARSVVIRLPTLAELHELQRCAVEDDVADGEAIAYSLAGLSLSDVDQLDPRVRQTLDDAIGDAIRDALAQAQRLASE